jgi:hypothetical protein
MGKIKVSLPRLGEILAVWPQIVALYEACADLLKDADGDGKTVEAGELSRVIDAAVNLARAIVGPRTGVPPIVPR